MTPSFEDELLDWDGPSASRIERTVKRLLRRLSGEPDDPDDPAPITPEDALDDMTSMLRSCGLMPNPLPPGVPHPLASAGPKLKKLRVRSGWTVEEIAERTEMSPDLLAAFEDGDSTAAGELTTLELERLAAACCGTLSDLLGREHPWVKAARRRESHAGIGLSCAIDPTG